MISILYLDKSEKEQWLPKLFALLYENMRPVGNLPYEEQWRQWEAEVSPALDKSPRQIILCLLDGDLIAYLQYYTRNDLLMIEEIQIKKEYQRTTIFLSLLRKLRSGLRDDIAYVEAFAEKRNVASQKLMTKLGMAEKTTEGADFAHFRGFMGDMKRYFR